EADEHLVAEQQAPTDLDHVARDAVVLGTDALAADHGQFGPAELSDACLVERTSAGVQVSRLRDQAGTNDLVATAFGGEIVGGILAGGWSCGVFGHERR